MGMQRTSTNQPTPAPVLWARCDKGWHFHFLYTSLIYRCVTSSDERSKLMIAGGEDCGREAEYISMAILNVLHFKKMCVVESTIRIAFNGKEQFMRVPNIDALRT